MKSNRASAWVVVVLGCLLGGGCDVIGGQVVVGSGKASEESRAVGRFDVISIGGSGRLIFRQGDEESLKIKADDNVLQYLTSSVEGNELRLGVRGNTSLQTHSPIVYTVTARDLKAVHLSGSVAAQLDSVSTDRLEVSISGTGNVVVTGRAKQQTVDISGSGDYDGAACPGATGEVHISGTGHVIVNVSGHLDAHISGSGDVDYLGHPSVSSHVSGTGHISSRS
ncbi:MAG TPA: head GIN domain-containing protein [Tepidisphaeraceae bacterium]|nr:head GIN domain-containing protein [Tepidisphaeraceae bacterium]